MVLLVVFHHPLLSSMNKLDFPWHCVLTTISFFHPCRHRYKINRIFILILTPPAVLTRNKIWDYISRKIQFAKYPPPLTRISRPSFRSLDARDTNQKHNKIIGFFRPTNKKHLRWVIILLSPTQ